MKCWRNLDSIENVTCAEKTRLGCEGCMDRRKKEQEELYKRIREHFPNTFKYLTNKPKEE